MKIFRQRTEDLELLVSNVAWEEFLHIDVSPQSYLNGFTDVLRQLGNVINLSPE